MLTFLTRIFSHTTKNSLGEIHTILSRSSWKNGNWICSRRWTSLVNYAIKVSANSKPIVDLYLLGVKRLIETSNFTSKVSKIGSSARCIGALPRSDISERKVKPSSTTARSSYCRGRTSSSVKTPSSDRTLYVTRLTSEVFQLIDPTTRSCTFLICFSQYLWDRYLAI